MTAQIPTDPQGRLATAYLMYTDAAGNVTTFVPDLVLSEEWSEPATVTENPVEQGPNITDNIRVELRKCTLKIFLTNEPLEPNNWTNLSFAPQTIALPTRTVPPPPNPIVLVPEWQNNLQEKVLVGTAGGVVGGGFGAVAGSVLANSLLGGRVIQVPTRVNAGLPPAPAPSSVGTQGFTPTDSDDYVALSIQFLRALKDDRQTIDVIGTKDSCLGTTPGVGGMAIEEFTWSRAVDDGTGATVTLGFKQMRVVTTQTVPAPAPSIPRAKAKTNGGNQQTSELGDAAAQAADNFVQGFNQGSADIQSLFSSSP